MMIFDNKCKQEADCGVDGPNEWRSECGSFPAVLVSATALYTPSSAPSAPSFTTPSQFVDPACSSFLNKNTAQDSCVRP